MRTPFGWTLSSQTSFHVLCACCLLWCAPAAAPAAPAAARSAPEQITQTPVISEPALAADASIANNTARIGDVSFNKRVLTLLAMGCVVGMIVGWASGGPRETRFRLLNKPKKTRLSVLVPAGPVPRLIPGDSPHATRASSRRAPVPRQTPVSTTRSGITDYIAAFTDGAATSEGGRVDFVLLSSDSADESSDVPDGFDDQLTA